MGFLDKAGLSELWSKCKAQFAPKEHDHDGLYYTESEVDELIANIGGGSADLSGYLPLSGGTMTGPVQLAGATTTGEIHINGGDGVGKGKIRFGATGQITDDSTATLCGRSNGNFIIGHSSYPLIIRGKATRPTYNGSSMALLSDIQSGALSAVDSETFTYNGG